MKKILIGWLIMMTIVMISCKKEGSFELGNTPSAGTLQSEVTGDCLPKSVNGTYIAAVPLVPATNTLTVTVDVTKIGVYTIYTDTINGYFFRGTGTFVKAGMTTVTLRSNGTPFTAGINNFVVTYEGSSCDIAVNVLATAPLPPAVFTLDCAGAVIGGSYATTNPLNFTNTVKLNVNVATIGTYSLSAAKNGMTFTKAGTFTATGAQTVTLNGTGIPTVNGNNDVPITVGTATCNFTIPVGNPSAGTLGTTAGACTPATIGGTYTLNTALVVGNTVQIQVTVTTPGVFSISTNTVAGMTFAASGTFSANGATGVTLNGTGTPTAAGPQTFIVTYGTSTCTFTVNVAGPAVAVYTPNCATATVAGTYQAGVALTAVNTITVPVTVTTAGTYNITTTSTNGMVFKGNGTLTLASTNIVLVGTGSTPTAAAAPSNIPIPGATSCNVPVTVTAAASPAVFSANCAGATVAGTYQAGVALTAANTITLPITVTTAGSYNISTTTTNGMVFKATGSLTLASTSIILVGTGSTPTAAAAPSNIPIPGAPGCNVPVTVTAAAGAAVFSANCAGATVAGTYQAGTPLTAANTITLPITVTTAGSYNISTTITNGMVFKASGTLTLASTSIVLVGTGSTPATAAAPSNIPIPGTTSCTVPVTVVADATIRWKFNIGTKIYQGQSQVANNEIQVSGSMATFTFVGDNAANDKIEFGLLDVAGGITVGDQYISSSGIFSNSCGFDFEDGASTIQPVAIGGSQDAQMIFIITLHNTATKTIAGTFSGTAMDLISNTSITITNGTFTAIYH